MKNNMNDILNSTVLNFRHLPAAVISKEDAAAAAPGTRPVPIAEVEAFEFNEDGSVTFNVVAPDAETVEVSGMSGSLWGTQRHTLEDQGNGWFRGTVEKVPAGFQYMQYYMDGKPILYPHAPVGRGYGYAVNYIDVPDAQQDFYWIKDVPHGSIRYETYYSEYTGNMRNCWVYTPPTYDS